MKSPREALQHFAISSSGDGLDTENDDENDAAEESVSKKARYGSKGSSRCRITRKQKALAVQHCEQMVPKPTHDDQLKIGRAHV